jgi:DNA-binding FrmR family transcriptional regulator
MECANCVKSKHRTEDEKKDLVNRLNRIEGQVRGIKQMIENDRYCGDVLIQLSAVNKSLKSLGEVMLKSHLETCVANDIKAGNMEIIDEVMDLFERLS